MFTRFVDIYGVRDQGNTEIILEQELEVPIITEDREAEVLAEEMLEDFLLGNEVSDLRLGDEKFLLEAEGDPNQKREENVLGQRKRQKEDDIHQWKCVHPPSTSQRTHNPERFYSEDGNEVQQEEDK